MKNLYIPKGKTLHYETLYCQNIVNDGTLIVDGTLHARSISGKGILKAGTVSVRHVAEMDIECATMNGETMAAERVCAAEIVLSGSATVSCYLEAEYVEVPKLTMAKHNIGTLKADDVITLPEKKRGDRRHPGGGLFSPLVVVRDPPYSGRRPVCPGCGPGTGKHRYGAGTAEAGAGRRFSVSARYPANGSGPGRGFRVQAAQGHVPSPERLRIHPAYHKAGGDCADSAGG